MHSVGWGMAGFGLATVIITAISILRMGKRKR